MLAGRLPEGSGSAAHCIRNVNDADWRCLTPN